MWWRRTPSWCMPFFVRTATEARLSGSQVAVSKPSSEAKGKQPASGLGCITMPPKLAREHLTNLASAVLRADHPPLDRPDQPLRIGVDHRKGIPPTRDSLALALASRRNAWVSSGVFGPHS